MIFANQNKHNLPIISHSLPLSWQWFLRFFLAAAILETISLGNLPLNDWDEAIRALVAREIYRTGNWLYPTLHGQPYFFKPPLMHWLIALSYHIGGITEFTTRLPGALFSACGVPLLYLVARKVFQEQLPAVFAASVYLTLLPVARHCRLAMLDGMVVSLFLLLLLCILKSCQSRWTLGIGFCLGAIALTKGLIVLLLGAIALTFIIYDKQLTLFKNHHFWLGIFVGFLPVVSWYTAQWQHYGSSFLETHFQAQGFQRISQAVDGNTGKPWYYLFELLKLSLPWLLFWPGGLYLAWQKRASHWGGLILIGTVIYLGAISIMKTKLPWYIMPLYPFFALAVAAQLKQLWQKKQSYPQLIVIVLASLACVGVAGAFYFILMGQLVLICMSLVAALTMSWSAWLVKQNQPQFIVVLVVGIYWTLLLVMNSHLWVWELYEAFPVKPVAALLQKTQPGSVIYLSFDDYRPSLDFYSDRQVIPAETQTLQKLWSTQPYLLVNQATLANLHLPNSVYLGTAEGYTLVAPTKLENLPKLTF